MMRKIFLISVFLVAGFSGLKAQTQQNARTDIPGSFVVGNVVALDDESLAVISLKDSFTAEKHGSKIIVTVAKSAMIGKQTDKGFNPAGLSDIKIADTLLVVGRVMGNGLEASRITINPIYIAAPAAPGQGYISGIIGRGTPPVLVMGSVTAVNKDSMTVTRTEDGETVTVKVNRYTPIKAPSGKKLLPTQIQLEDVRLKDTVVSIGSMEGAVLLAQSVYVNPVLGRALEVGQQDMGKIYISGHVKAVDYNKRRLTIEKPDGQTQEIGTDEKTSFFWLSNSITLQSIRAGDLVCGPGELRDGIFIAKSMVLISAENASGKSSDVRQTKAKD